LKRLIGANRTMRAMKKPILLAWVSLGLVSSMLVFAASYTVKAGDTLFSIAKANGVSVEAIQKLNKLSNNELRVGQVLQLPNKTPTKATSKSPAVGRRETFTTKSASSQTISMLVTKSVDGKVSVSHRASCIPGDPVLIRVRGITEKPVVRWGSETLVMTRDDADWVGVGRELLGEKPKVVLLQTLIGDETINSSLKLMPDPQRVQNVFMSQQVLSTLTDENRKRELAILNAAHKKSEDTPRLWTKPFLYPRPPAMSSPFAQARYYKKNDEVNYHYGQDIAGRMGDPIYATNDGVVEVAGLYPIRGGIIGINHGAGVVSLYFHLSKFNAKVGQRVTRGQLIGKVGNTGFSTGPHLHWEMRVRAEATDPRQWANRLFPL
jgi:murein DD-endopeptidase MepM/ murein hydrolase activator NlpD